MAFTSAITYRGVSGNQLVTRGTYTSASSSTGGDIDTGLSVCKHIKLTPGGSAVHTGESVVNETLPIAGNAVTIVTDADGTGYWEAVGLP